MKMKVGQGVGGAQGWDPNALVAAGLSKECTTIFSLYLGILTSGTTSSNYGVQDCILPSHPHPPEAAISHCPAGNSFQVLLKPDRDSQPSRCTILGLAFISTSTQALCQQRRAVWVLLSADGSMVFWYQLASSTKPWHHFCCCFQNNTVKHTAIFVAHVVEK